MTTLRFAFLGRCSTEDQQDPESSRGWQRNRATALIEPHGGIIVAEFFYIEQSRSLPWQRRPEASALLRALRDPARGFDAVVIGEPHRAFYGNQFGLTFPLFTHYGVDLWVPEVGGPLDPDNEAHDLVMSVFGGMSKGERNRIKVRVRTAMAAQTKLEGRFLGGRPPYGYRLIDLGPHPNPGKAADGKRLHGLALDDNTAPVVARIFAEFLAGNGLYVIARTHRRRHPLPLGLRPGTQPPPLRHRLVQERHPSHPDQPPLHRPASLKPPTHRRDPARRQRRRHGPHQRHALEPTTAVGHVQRRSTPSDHRHRDLRRRAGAPTPPGRGPGDEHKKHRARHIYLLKGSLYCALCNRKMQGQRSNGEAYYRCRYAQEYALANKINHPRNVYLRERDLIGPLDAALAQAFAPHRIADTITALAEHQEPQTSTTRPTAPAPNSPSANQTRPSQGSPRSRSRPHRRHKMDRRGRSRTPQHPGRAQPSPPPTGSTTPDTTADKRSCRRAGQHRHRATRGRPHRPRRGVPADRATPDLRPRKAESPRTGTTCSGLSWGNGWCPRGDLNPHALYGH